VVSSCEDGGGGRGRRRRREGGQGRRGLPALVGRCVDGGGQALLWVCCYREVDGGSRRLILLDTGDPQITECRNTNRGQKPSIESPAVYPSQSIPKADNSHCTETIFGSEEIAENTRPNKAPNS
jgi:hypothetical protein